MSQSAHSVSSRAQRGTFPVASKVPRCARDDSGDLAGYVQTNVVPRPHQALQQRRPQPVRAVVHRPRARRLHPSRLRARRRGAARPLRAPRRRLASRCRARHAGQAHRGDARLPARAARARPVRQAVARGGLSRHLGVHRSAADGDGARGGAVVRRARLRAAHDGLRAAQGRPAHLGAAALLHQADLPRRSSTTPWPAASRPASACTTI